MDPAVITAKAASEAAALSPGDMLDAAAWLAEPAMVMRNAPWLASELVKIALGRSDLWFDERDKRFADTAWQAWPFRVFGQSYRLRPTLPDGAACRIVGTQSASRAGSARHTE